MTGAPERLDGPDLHAGPDLLDNIVRNVEDCPHLHTCFAANFTTELKRAAGRGTPLAVEHWLLALSYVTDRCLRDSARAAGVREACRSALVRTGAATAGQTA